MQVVSAGGALTGLSASGNDAADLRTRLVVLDTRPLVRWALANIAGTSPDLNLVAEVATVDEASTAIYALKPQVVTIDCSIEHGQGWDLAQQLRAEHPDLGIVLLCADGSDEQLFRALDSGASAFLAVSASVHEVVAAIRHAAIAAQSFTASGLAQALRRRNHSATKFALSARERQVLGLLREGRSVPQVAAQLFVSLSTAKTYVARLYEKLGANNRAQALMTAVEQGLFETELVG